MKRGPVTKSNSKQVLVWFPDPLISLVDSAVSQLDTDRSKFIRAAVREKISRHGAKDKEAA